MRFKMARTGTDRVVQRRPHTALRMLRISRGWSPNDLGSQSGISGKHIRMIEAGFIPGPRTQYAIAQALGVGPLDLWPFVNGRQVVPR